MVDLVPVVVLGRVPEDGEHDDAELLLERLGEPGGGEGLVDGVEGSGEESRLLAGGDDCPALLDEALEPESGALGGGAEGGGRAGALVGAEAGRGFGELGAEGVRIVGGGAVERPGGAIPAQVVLCEG